MVDNNIIFELVMMGLKYLNLDPLAYLFNMMES